MQHVSTLWRRALVVGATFALLALVAGCGSDDKLLSKLPGEGSTGDADFTSYVAIGNSLTAGYQSAALTSTTNDFSYPNLIAQQVGTAFEQPEIADPGIGAYFDLGGGILQLRQISIPPVITPDTLTVAQFSNPASMLTNATHPAPYNNLGIPGALAIDIPTATSTATAPSASPFFDLVLRGLGTTVDQALMLNATFATVWLGNNDVLGYATSGGTNPPAPMPAANVEAAIGAVVAQLDAAGVKMAIANLPDMAAIPYFTTVKPYLTVTGTSVPVLDGQGNKQFFLGPDGFLTDADMIVLTAQTVMAPPPEGPGQGSVIALEDQYVLSAAEQAIAQAAVDAYNVAIAGIAAQYGLALVDINSLFDSIVAEGIDYGGLDLNAGFLSGGIFSLDGVHPTNVGQAVVANEFIAAINTTYNADIPLVSVYGAIAHTP